MKKLGVLLVVLLVVASLSACGKKEQAMEEMQPLTMDTMGNVSTAPVSEAAAPVIQAQPLDQAKLDSVPQAIPKPSAVEIQTALKNANFYMGEIDGKLGPMSKKAIEEFQKANTLKVDGKVGPQTWEALAKYLNPAPAAPSKKR